MVGDGDTAPAAACAEEEEAMAAARLAVSPPGTTALGLVVVILAELMLLKVDAESCTVTVVMTLDAKLGCAHVSFPAPSSSSLFCTLSSQ